MTRILERKREGVHLGRKSADRTRWEAERHVQLRGQRPFSATKARAEQMIGKETRRRGAAVRRRGFATDKERLEMVGEQS